MKTGAAWLLLAALVFLPALGVRAEQVYGSVQVVLPPEAAGVELTLYKAAQAGGTGYYYAEDSGFTGGGGKLPGPLGKPGAGRVPDRADKRAGAD